MVLGLVRSCMSTPAVSAKGSLLISDTKPTVGERHKSRLAYRSLLSRRAIPDKDPLVQIGYLSLDTTMQVASLLILVATLATAPFANGRVVQTPRSSAPTVDLGYVAYQGYHDETYGLNVWKRYPHPIVYSLG